MAKRITWSEQAHLDRQEILQYWTKRNQSKTYSIKLNKLFKEAVRILAKYPGIGKPTDLIGVRGKIVRDYIIFYQVEKDVLQILTIWDTRQDPVERKEKIKKGYN